MIPLEQTKNGSVASAAFSERGSQVGSGVLRKGGWFRNAFPQILPGRALRNRPSFATQGGYSKGEPRQFKLLNVAPLMLTLTQSRESATQSPHAPFNSLYAKPMFPEQIIAGA